MAGVDMPVYSSNQENASAEIRVLTLNAGDNLENRIFQFKLGWSIRFTLGPSLFGQNIYLYINVPEGRKEFVRTQYRRLIWTQEHGNGSDDSALYAQVKFTVPNSFHYYFRSEESDERLGCGYLLVNPSLCTGPDSQALPLDAIQCQTVLSKLLGPLNEWENRLLVSKKSGYNMIHFTPIQALGASNSSYSIQDHNLLNPAFNDDHQCYEMSDVGDLVEKMNHDWHVLSVTDVVLNHTANESPLLQRDPDASYNLINSPHLRPAYLLDRALQHFSTEIVDGKWNNKGLPDSINQEHHLDIIRNVLQNSLLPMLKVHEMFTVDVDKAVKVFENHLKAFKIHSVKVGDRKKELKIIQGRSYRRNASTVDFNAALSLFVPFDFNREDEKNIKHCCTVFRHKLINLNSDITNLVNNHLQAAVANVIQSIRYERLQHDGPNIKRVTKKHPLVPCYFTHPVSTKNLDEEEDIIWSDKSSLIMAHNGWVMNDNPLKNFAEKDSNVYLRRELIVWGDSVKLRYGKEPQDSPHLWAYMRSYVANTARIFHGIRLDNCHSTPIEVAEYMLDAARQVRPNIYIFAELFTSNEETDNIFVNRLGINSLIREAMSAHDSHELGRLVHRYSGSPVGSFFQPKLRPLVPTIAHAMFLDLTHDNPSPIQKRSVYDLIPSSALVAMACSASGSNRGYDELVPYHIHVVNESRLYTSWNNSESSADMSTVNLSSGIIRAKMALNDLHNQLGTAGFNEVYVDQVTADVVAITRHNSTNHSSVILVAHTAFPGISHDKNYYTPPLCIPGVVNEIIFEAQLNQETNGSVESSSENFITGLNNFSVKMKEHGCLQHSEIIKVKKSDASTTEVNFINFPPGSVIAFKVSLSENSMKSVLKAKEIIAELNAAGQDPCNQSAPGSFQSVISQLFLSDLNRVLFHCDSEERDEGNGFGVYNIPNYGNMPYCGLQGIIGILSKIRINNDLGHPLCENLRSGNWLMEYTVNRLLMHPSTKTFGDWMTKVLEVFKDLPRYLVPCYFDIIITMTYSLLLSRIWDQMSSFVKNGSSFVKSLSLGSVQMAGVVDSAPLPQLSPNLAPPVAPDSTKGASAQKCVTLSAGLPHFSVGYMRNWGRDTFISLRGLFLLTGRVNEARLIILAYSGCLRHGLIPNLLNKGTESRFNCRDAVWWWLQAIQDYCKLVKNGHSILKDKVARIFPKDDSVAEQPGEDQFLCDVMQEALQRHVEGVTYRESNAGHNLDSEMSSDGFNISIGVDNTTGFVFGGSISNCGTWMDKMGSSESSGTKGKPATPRDGSAVELVGLCASTVSWLDSMFEAGYYPYNSTKVNVNDALCDYKFKDWATMICKSFENYFWIDVLPNPANELKPELINRRGIYKDSFNASQSWADYQLRPNFTISMVVAPELFNPQHAWHALSIAEKELLGPLGMKTLDSSDWVYNGCYNNSDHSSNPHTANGYNYHQGPEWLWPVGYFCRAKLKFASAVGGKAELERTKQLVKSILSNHYKAIKQSPWHGLPELTNRNGAVCHDSCPIQAWSHACLLEVLYDLHVLDEE